MGFFKKFLNDEKGVTSIEIAVATPLLGFFALSCVEVTGFVLFHQKMDRAVTAMGDLTAQARGLTADDLANIYDAAEYIMRPFDLDTNGTVIVSAISTSDPDPATVNWQWQSSTGLSEFGNEGQNATLPSGLLVRDGESLIVSEIFVSYDPIVLGDMFEDKQYYQNALFRPRFDALTSLD